MNQPSYTESVDPALLGQYCSITPNLPLGQPFVSDVRHWESLPQDYRSRVVEFAAKMRETAKAAGWDAGACFVQWSK